MSDINDFKDLIIWQKGMDIAQRCYFLTKLFPKDELYGMVQQVRRSAVSIPANISEGFSMINWRELLTGNMEQKECQILMTLKT